MQPYRSTGGDSGVVAYACGPGWIDIRFRRGGTESGRDSKHWSIEIFLYPGDWAEQTHFFHRLPG